MIRSWCIVSPNCGNNAPVLKKPQVFVFQSKTSVAMITFSLSVSIMANSFYEVSRLDF